MLFVHENNIQTKIKANYKEKKEEIKQFYENIYLEVKKSLLQLNFSISSEDSFRTAAEIINNYFKQLNEFSEIHGIRSESKFRSSFLEEISTYLFVNNEYIQNKKLGFFNKGIYAGLKIENNLRINIIKKDVDFCIGRKVNINLDEIKYEIIIPIIAVETKTYLDGTMLGEVQHSCKLIKNATPNVKNFVLMEYNQVGLEKIMATRYNNEINEMFVLRFKKDYDIEFGVLMDYYEQITRDIDNIANEKNLILPGRLINI